MHDIDDPREDSSGAHVSCLEEARRLSNDYHGLLKAHRLAKLLFGLFVLFSLMAGVIAWNTIDDLKRQRGSRDKAIANSDQNYLKLKQERDRLMYQLEDATQRANYNGAVARGYHYLYVSGKPGWAQQAFTRALQHANREPDGPGWVITQPVWPFAVRHLLDREFEVIDRYDPTTNDLQLIIRPNPELQFTPSDKAPKPRPAVIQTSPPSQGHHAPYGTYMFNPTNY